MKSKGKWKSWTGAIKWQYANDIIKWLEKREARKRASLLKEYNLKNRLWHTKKTNQRQQALK